MPKRPLQSSPVPHEKETHPSDISSTEVQALLSESWKEEVELPDELPLSSSSLPPPPPPPMASCLFQKKSCEGSDKLAQCVQRLFQAPANGFCRIEKQQWGLPTQRQKEKLRGARFHSQTMALIESLEKKANPTLPEGQNIWPHIENFFEQALHPQLKSLTNKLALFSSLLNDLASPENILPEPPSIATMASLHQEFARDFPAEYTRTFCLLAGPAGECTLLGGDALRLAESAPFVYSASVSSALMEAAFYGYLLRRSALDSLLSETFENNSNPAQRISLSPWLLPPLIRQLFGIGYESETFWSPQDACCSLRQLSQLPQILPNRPVIFYLLIQKKQQPVVFETVREERVFFRNNIGKLFSLSLKSFVEQATSIFFPT